MSSWELFHPDKYKKSTSDPLDMFSGTEPYAGGGSGGMGDIFGPPMDLGDPITTPGSYDPGFTDDLWSDLDKELGMIPQGGQIDLGGVPQPLAQTFMDGYDPQTLSQMRGRAIDDTSRSGISQMSQMRQALGRAGFGADSPASAGIFGDVAAQTGAAQNDALRNIDISNGELQNTNRANSMAAVNAMALANANRMFEAMSQNAQMQQQMAGAKAGMIGQFGSQLEGAKLSKKTGADAADAAAKQHLKDLQFGAGEDRWKTGVGALSGMAGAPISGFQPTTSGLGGILGSIGQSGLAQGLAGLYGPKKPVQTDSPMDSSIFKTQAYA